MLGKYAKMERVTGIGPVSTTWEAVVLPLNYTRLCSDKDYTKD